MGRSVEVGKTAVSKFCQFSKSQPFLSLLASPQEMPLVNILTPSGADWLLHMSLMSILGLLI